MTLFLRNNKNRSIVDIELNETRVEGNKIIDIRVATIIEPYSNLLLENIHRKEEVIADFSEIDELRGWLWETYMEMVDEPSFNDVLKEIKGVLIKAAEKYSLNFITD